MRVSNEAVFLKFEFVFQQIGFVNRLGIKWFETLRVSSLSEAEGFARSVNALRSPDHRRSKIFRTTPKLVSGLPFYPSNSVGVKVPFTSNVPDLRAS